MHSKLVAAVDLAKQGYRVFPLAMNGKTPVHDGNWRKLATTDPARIKEMWTCPVMDAELDYNIGIALDANTLVVDIDVRDGKQGLASLAVLEACDEVLPATRTVRTASDGIHREYRVPGNSGAFPKELATHIDLKGEGGYVVAPGSEINGRFYRRETAGLAAPAPEFVMRLGGHAPRPKPPEGQAIPGVDIAAAVKQGIEWLRGTAPAAIEGQGGDNATIVVANHLGDLGLTAGLAASLMLDHWNDEKAIPSWDPTELETKVASAFKSRQNPIGVRSASAELDAQSTRSVLKGGIELHEINVLDAIDIPQRQWVLGKFAAKHYLSGLVSPPGVGKTTFLLMVAVAVASGRDDITGLKVHKRERVLLWNQEDETDELKRRLIAVMTAFDVKWDDIAFGSKPGIVLGSGIDRRLMFAKRNASGAIKPAEDAKVLEDYLTSEGFGLAVFDPFVEMHEANENDNTEIATVGAVFRRVAVKANCAVLLAHHTRKPPAASASDAYAGNMDTARGAGSLGGVARMVATLYGIDSATGKRYGVSEADCRRYIRFDDAKANMSLVSGEPMFFRREGVTIGGFGGEEVGVLRPAALSRSRDAKTAARDDLVLDCLEALGDAEARPVADIAKDLAALPMRADTSPEALAKAIKRTFEQTVKTDNNDNLFLEERSIPGVKGRRVVLCRTAGQPQKRDVRPGRKD